MSARYRQVSRGRWPHGIDKPIAILHAEPTELERRYSFRFSHGQDDLDEFQEAGLKLRSGRAVLLMRYRRSPGPGTTLSIDRGDDATEALREVRESLQIGRRELAWVSDEVQEPRRPRLATLAYIAYSWLAGGIRRKHRVAAVAAPATRSEKGAALHAG